MCQGNGMRRDVEDAIKEALGKTEKTGSTTVEVSGTGNVLVLGDFHAHERIVVGSRAEGSESAMAATVAGLHRAK